MSGAPPTALPPALRATYRLQFNRTFGLREAIALVPYLHELGISHVYASPLLKACPGSSHGYDVCDHSQINPEIGTEAELEELVCALRAHDMGLVLDIVPNHMGICGRENAWWWDVLKHGRSGEFAVYFDIDWDAPDPRLHGKVLVPVLQDAYERVLARGELQVLREAGEWLITYQGQRFPLAPDTFAASAELAGPALDQLNADPEALAAVLQKQNYLLAHWREGAARLNYRRFFDISTLAGIRVEDPRVFGAAHATVLRWYANGWIDGFRVDHPDGLYDPTEYFERLRAAAPNAWIVAEKILQPGEMIPEAWPVAGTTGYEFIRRVTGLFVDPAGAAPLTELYAKFTGEPTDYGAVVRDKQRLVLRKLFPAEVGRLTRLLRRIAGGLEGYRDLEDNALREALIEVTTRLPYYCTYVQAHLGRISAADAGVIAETIARSRDCRRDLPPAAFALLADLLLLRINGGSVQEFVMRFQQLTGPAMAKGAEDTACYCFNRLIALNNVGGDPGQFALAPEAFHERCARSQLRWPVAMLTAATHDTKRSGDVRMRLCLLAEVPQRWQVAVAHWTDRNAKYRRGDWPDRNFEYFYYQTLVGAWPLPSDRALVVMEKAAHEAKQHTSWNNPNPAYDGALREFVSATLADQEFVSEVERFVASLRDPGWVNSLAQTLLLLTAPGVPDIYQGTELWDLSLMDPDNRRPVDFAARQRLQDEMKNLSVTEIWQRRKEGLPKLWLIQKTLQFRRQHPQLFGEQSTYKPLQVRGERAGHVVAFARGQRVVTVVPRLVLRRGGSWGDTTVRLPGTGWHNQFTGETSAGPDCRLGDLLKEFPVALLARKETS